MVIVLPNLFDLITYNQILMLYQDRLYLPVLFLEVVNLHGQHT